MATNPITNSDTLRALNGQPSVEQADYNNSVVESLHGFNPEQHKADRRILEALNAGEPNESALEDLPRIGSGNLAVEESEHKWLSDLAIEAADSTLGAALMRQHPGMSDQDLSTKAQSIINECYAEGAKRSDSEIERLDYAAEKATRIAQDMLNKPATIAPVTESKAPAKKLERIQEAGKPAQDSALSPIVVAYESSDGKELSRRRLTIAEADALAEQPNGKLVIEQAQRIHDVTKGHASP